MKTKTQFETVKSHIIKKGKITSWEAIEKYRITRLSAYIIKMRKEGHLIISEWIKSKDKNPYVKYVYVGNKNPDKNFRTYNYINNDKI